MNDTRNTDEPKQSDPMVRIGNTSHGTLHQRLKGLRARSGDVQAARRLFERALPDLEQATGGKMSFDVPAGFDGDPVGLAWSPDGRWLAFAHGPTLSILDTRDGQECYRLVEKGSALTAFAFSPDWRWLAYAQEDHAVRMWDVQLARLTATLMGHTATVRALAFRPEGDLLASAGDDLKVRAWSVRSGRTTGLLAGHRQAVTALGWSRDGTTLISCAQGETRWWDVVGQRLRGSVDGPDPSEPVRGLNAGATMLATGVGERKIRLWNLTVGSCVAEGESPDDRRVTTVVRDASVGTPHSGARIRGATALAFSDDGSRVAVGSHDQSVFLWQRARKDAATLLLGHDGPPRGIAFRPGGTMMASLSTRELQTWDLAAGKLLRTARWTPAQVASLEVSPDGRWMASTGDVLRVWDLALGRLVAVEPPARAHGTAFRPGTTILAVGGVSGIELWDLAAERKVGAVPSVAHAPSASSTEGGPDANFRVEAIAFSSDGRWMARVVSPEVTRWQRVSAQVHQASHAIEVTDLASPSGETKTLRGHTARVRAIAFSPGRPVLVSGAEDATVRLWDVESGRSIRTLSGHAREVHLVAFSPAGKVIASCDSEALRLLDANRGTTLHELDRHAASVTRILFSRDGSLLFAAMLDGTVRSWDAARGSPARTYHLHRDQAWGIGTSGDDQVLITGGHDGWIRLSRVRDGQQLAVVRPIAGMPSAVVLGPGGAVDLLGQDPSAHVVGRIGPYTFPFDLCAERFVVPGLLGRLLEDRSRIDVSHGVEGGVPELLPGRPPSGPEGKLRSALLLYRSPEARDCAVELPLAGGYLGRWVDCLVRSDDETVSRRHCRVYPSGGQWWVENLSSSGTYVNGQPVEKATLSHGDVLRCETLQVRFIESAVGGAAAALRQAAGAAAASAAGEPPSPDVAAAAAGGTAGQESKGGVSEDPIVGTVIGGRFEIDSRIDEGGSAFVYLAKDLPADRRIALKVLTPQAAADPSFVRRFHVTARTIAELGHPNLLTIFDEGQTSEGLHFVAMEGLIGSLREEMDRRGRLAPVRALDVLAQASRGVAAAHARGLVHGNLKPEKIYLCPSEGGGELVKVIYSTAAQVEDGDGSKDGADAVVGTPCYMSPEQAKGGALDSAADIYGLGVILYEMLAGEPPFDAPNPVDVLMMHVRDRPPELEGIPEVAARIVMKALEKDPQWRQRSCQQLADECERARRGLEGGGGKERDPLVARTTAHQASYEIMARLGESESGVLYKARQPTLDREVTLHVIGVGASSAVEPAMLKRFQGEARLLARIDHPHAVRVLDFGQDRRGLLFAALEKLDGGTLRDELRRLGRLPPVRALGYLAQAARAIGQAHSLGILHRDVKPDHLYLCRGPEGEDWVKVLGFAPELSVGKKRGATAMVGTPRYMSPEQGRGAILGPPSDVYSMGVVLYELVSGKPPFDAVVPTEVVTMHQRDPLPPLHHVPAALEEIVMTALEKDPAKRHASGREFAEACETAADELQELYAR